MRITQADNPKIVDQELTNPGGSLTSNGKFFEAAREFKLKQSSPESVQVYEKIRKGIWVYNGLFNLVDAYQEPSEGRKVFKFRLELVEDSYSKPKHRDLIHNRVIPASVKIEAWKRDKGRCVKCGSEDNLHYDHILPYSKGGSSLVTENVQILCARHNLEKRDRIE